MPCEDYDQIKRIHRLIRFFAGCTCNLVKDMTPAHVNVVKHLVDNLILSVYNRERHLSFHRGTIISLNITTFITPVLMHQIVALYILEEIGLRYNFSTYVAQSLL